MLRDQAGRPIGDHFVHHGTDVETRWRETPPLVTSNDRFFVRNHTEPPEIDARAWRLLVTGDGVVRETTYTLAELERFTQHEYTRAIECTGNGRRLFGEQQGTPRPGTQWGLGAIGVARWRGVRLSTLLAHAGLRSHAVQVMPVGLDEPYVADGLDHGRVRRPLPIDKALDDVLVAWEMNGEPLPRDHGHPVRLLVPGWVGIASIKWLGELRVTTSVEDSPWNTRWYRMHGEGWTSASGTLDRMPVKSTLDPVRGLVAGHGTVLTGRAWSGEATIRRVQVSTDTGRTWRDARLTGGNEPSAWARWETPWTPPYAGLHEVRVRATDSDGRTQPDVARDNDDGYLFDAVVRHPVLVADPPSGGQSRGGLQITVSDGV
jgi:DMSO/TMAO reductase YedYZ molybdopterin-dependent catalytic subunit